MWVKSKAGERYEAQRAQSRLPILIRKQRIMDRKIEERA